MKNREFLNLIGSVNEDYIQAADSKVVRPRFRWKTFAAGAACAALIICAYPVYRMVTPPLHSYTVVKRGGTMNTLDGESTVTGGQGATDNFPGGAYVGNESTPSGGDYGIEDPGAGLSGAPTDKATQYDRLLQGMGVRGDGEYACPDWFAGAWFDDGILTVGIVDEFRTSELEMEIKGWVQTDIAFQGAKYSYTYLNALMEKTVAHLEGTGLTWGAGVDVMANRLGVDLYNDNEEAAPEFKKVLAALAELDPAGDAIRVRVFAGQTNALTDGVADGPTPAPVPGGITEPAPGTVESGSVQERVQPAGVEG